MHELGIQDQAAVGLRAPQSVHDDHSESEDADRGNERVYE